MRYVLLIAALTSCTIVNAQAGGCLGNEPVAIATMDLASPARICQGDAVAFDGSASTPGSGTNIVEYKWSFGDGTLDSLSGALANHTYSNGGQYTVQLFLTANNGCESINTVDLVVQVSTTPSFEGTMGNVSACAGDTVVLTAAATAIPWSSALVAEFGGGALLPDLQGVPFISSIEVSSFEPGATIPSADLVPDICVSMEHSYMGDMVIQVTCPNGQIMVMHQQGGGGTYLGEPIDDESDTPGTCWDYCWSVDATNGTWADNAGGTLPAGSYESVEPFDNLVGCPLNGTWTLSVTDLFAIDNGFLCQWAMSLDSIAFTPVLGMGADSSGWSGSGIILGADPLQAMVVPSTLGSQDYTFSVTDNFGCTYDTTITVTALDLQIDAIVGPAVLPGPGEVTYTISPPMPGAEAIVWDPLPAGWLWSSNDLDHVDDQAVLNAPTQSGTVQICAQAIFEGCTGDIVCIDVASFVGIDDGGIIPGHELQLLPNPSDGHVLLMRKIAGGNLALDVIDASGRIVHTTSMSGTSLSMDLTRLAPGTYQLRWSEGGRERRTAFVIAR